MIKEQIKSEKGITLAALAITVIIMTILAGVIIFNASDSVRTEKLQNMQSDINVLSDKISSYYAQYGKIPVTAEYPSYPDFAYTFSEAIGATDTGKFYVIDLSALDNLSLNNGYSFENLKNVTSPLTEQQEKDNLDLYVINEDSHAIFYVQGVNTGAETYYTNYSSSDKDQESLSLVNVDQLYQNELYTPFYDINGSYKDKNENVVVVPAGFRVFMNNGENTVEDGLVIEDENGNQFVWVAVPKDIYTNVRSDTDYENIENALKSYTNDYTTTEYSDKYVSGDGGFNESDYNNQYHKMLTSIYNNGGFWISRYEIGSKNAGEAASNDTNVAPVSQQNAYPVVNKTQAQSEQIVRKLNNNANLLFGIQWDLTLKFLQENADLSMNDITTDSTKWGNFVNSSVNINQGQYQVDNWESINWMNINSGSTVTKATSSIWKLTTGASNSTKKLNIFDIAGNVAEWTLESNSTGNIIARGGDGYNQDSESSAENHAYHGISDANSYTGFRATIY